LAKHSVSALTYAEAAEADLDPPLVVFTPDRWLLNDSEFAGLAAGGTRDLLLHAQRIFQREFSSQEELLHFSRSLRTVEDVASAVKAPDALLYDTAWPRDPIAQLKREAERAAADNVDELTRLPSGQRLFNNLFGRMMQTNDIIANSVHVGGTPLVTAPTSWQYFLWKHERDQQRLRELGFELDQDAIVAQTLMSEQPHLSLIGNVPLETLIELRRQGALAELRESLRTGISTIEHADPSVTGRVSNEVATNIAELLKRHQKEVADIRAGKKIVGFDAVRWVVSAGVTLAGAAYGGVVGGAIALAVSHLIGTPDPKKLWDEAVSVMRRTERSRRSAAGILFRRFDS
jgi:hypothetical protein